MSKLVKNQNSDLDIHWIIYCLAKLYRSTQLPNNYLRIEAPHDETPAENDSTENLAWYMQAFAYMSHCSLRRSYTFNNLHTLNPEYDAERNQ